MTNQEIANTCFQNLPNVKQCWVTSDGHYHLHSANGGERFERGVETKKEEVLANPKKKK